MLDHNRLALLAVIFSLGDDLRRLLMSMPGPWVNPELRDAEPWTNDEGVIKFFEFPIRLPVMSRRAFHLYWQKHHSANVMNITEFAQFMRKYNSGHIYPDQTPGLPGHYRQEHLFEGAAEVWINGWREVSAWLGKPVYGELIRPDELRFIDQDRGTTVLLTKEEILYQPDPDMAENGLVKLYLLFARKPGLDRDQFHRTLSAHGRQLVQFLPHVPPLRKLVISHKLGDPMCVDGIVPTDIDAVMELWFTNRDDMTRFIAGSDYRSNFQSQESSFADARNIRALVCKMRVVHDEFSFQPSTTQPLPFNWSE
jgi:hypothetical protein